MICAVWLFQTTRATKQGARHFFFGIDRLFWRNQGFAKGNMNTKVDKFGHLALMSLTR
jgi:hypothetical protein